jgi:predicted Fe-S protein YdhL (DUF1289 family)
MRIVLLSPSVLASPAPSAVSEAAVSVELASRFLPSPCIGTCQLDAASGWCLGCARDATELTHWRDLDARTKAAVWADLPRRKTRLGLSFRLKPWPPTEALHRFRAMALQPGARLAIGPYAAVAASELSLDEGRPILRGDDFRLLLRPDPTLRLFELEDRYVLAVHRSRLEPSGSVIRDCGLDEAALDLRARTSARFDLGFGCLAARVSVRTADPAAARRWRDRCGQIFDGDVPPGDVTTIVSLPIGRLEHRGPPPADRPGAAGLPDAYVACVALLRDGRTA